MQINPMPMTLIVVDIPVVASSAKAGAYSVTLVYSVSCRSDAELATNLALVPNRRSKYLKHVSGLDSNNT